jgi:tetratricopeptide (TPR) repeat protein
MASMVIRFWHAHGGAAMKKSILTFLAAAAITWGTSWAQGGYSSGRVQSLLTSGDAGSAVRYAASWTRAEPNNDSAWGSLGIAYAEGVHRPDKALPAFKYALAINPYSPQNYNALGEACLAEKKFPAAAEAFEHASDLAPTKSVYWNNLAAAYTALDETDRALVALKKNEVVAAPHGTWIDWYNLGAAYDKLKAYEKAVTAYTRALQLNPRGATVWTSLGAAEQALGRSDSAAEHYKLAMALGDKAGAQKYAKLQSAAATAPTRSLTAMTMKHPG